MGTARYLLALCILAWTHCMARIDAQNLGVTAYTDCTSGSNSKLIVSDVYLTPSSPYPNDYVTLAFYVSNPSATENVIVKYLYCTLGFDTPIASNQSFADYPMTVTTGTRNYPFYSNSTVLNQLYSTGTIPFQIMVYSNWVTNVACASGNVTISAPPSTQSDVMDNSQVTVSALTLTPTPLQFYKKLTLSFEVENVFYKTVAFNSISWWITFNGRDTPLWYTENLGTTGVSLKVGASRDITCTSINQTQADSLNWFVYTLYFTANGTKVANWKGWGAIPSSPPNPSDCLGSGSRLNVSNVALNPSFPQINQPIYFTFEVENWSNVSVTFNDIYSILTFNPSSPIFSNLTLPELTLPALENMGLAGKEVVLNQSVSSGSYPYQFMIYSNSTTEIACWGGNVTIPNQGDCLIGRSKLKVTDVVLNPTSYQIDDPVNLRFTVENESGRNVALNSIYWTLTFNSTRPVEYDLSLGTNVILEIGNSLTLNWNSLTLKESNNAGTYQYQFEFYEDATEIACWGGDVTVRIQGDCLIGRSQLKVTNAILIPNSPQIYDPVNLLFTVENESGKNVAFNGIYWTLTFTPGKPVRRDLTLGSDIILISGASLDLNGKSFTLSESISAGKYPYQIEIYEDVTKIACWGGEIDIPSLNPSLKTSKTEDQ